MYEKACSYSNHIQKKKIIKLPRMNTDYLKSAKQQFQYCKQLGDKTMAQLNDEQLFWQYNDASNSIAIMVKHLWGNMMSRWTDFLTTDGEKDFRKRDEEFELRVGPSLQGVDTANAEGVDADNAEGVDNTAEGVDNDAEGVDADNAEGVDNDAEGVDNITEGVDTDNAEGVDNDAEDGEKDFRKRDEEFELRVGPSLQGVDTANAEGVDTDNAEGVDTDIAEGVDMDIAEGVNEHTRVVITEKWEQGWACLFTALDSINEDNFDTTIYIRNQGHSIPEAINRQMMHYAYHVGQIVYLGRMMKGEDWQSLSIPKGNSKAYNAEKFSQEKGKRHFTDEYLGKS
ncbi:MAG: hypothetical protein ACI9M3_000783 [Bacteroidia bacterium]|jgi:hypothetical protein